MLWFLTIDSVAFAGPDPTPLPPGIIAWWTFDNTGRELKSESLGLFGEVYWSNYGFNPSGIWGSLILPGYKGAGVHPETPLPDDLQDFTIEAFIRRLFQDEMSFEGDIGTVFGSESGLRFGVFDDGRFRFGSEAAGFVSSPPVILDVYAWHHLAVTLKGSTLKFFQDGKLVSTHTWTDNRRFPGPLGIGCVFPTGTEPLSGQLDELTIYNRALTEEELASIAESRRGKTWVEIGVHFVEFSKPVVLNTDARVLVEVGSTGRQGASSVTLTNRIPKGVQYLRTGITDAIATAIHTNAAGVVEIVSTLPPITGKSTNRVELWLRLVGTNSPMLEASLGGLPATDIQSNNNSDTLILATEQACLEPREGMLRRWTFEGERRELIEGSKTTLVGNARFGSGFAGEGLILNGIKDRLTLNGDRQPTLTNFTVESWIRLGDLREASTLLPDRVLFDLSTPFYHHSLDILPTGRIGIETLGANTPNIYMQEAIRDREWHHVAISRSDDRLRLWLDGALQISVPDYFPPRYGSKLIALGGGEGWSGFSVFPISIDEVGLYNRELSEASIRAIYNAGRTPQCLRPDVGIEAQTSKGSYTASDSIPVSFRVKNRSSMASTPLRVSLTITNILGGVTWSRSDVGQGTINHSESPPVWELPPLQPGGEARLDLALRSPPGIVSTEARLLPPAAGVVPDNDVAVVHHTVLGECSTFPSGLAAWWPLDDDLRDVITGVKSESPIREELFNGQAFNAAEGGSRSLGNNPGWQSQDFTVAVWMHRWDTSRDPQSLFMVFFQIGDLGQSFFADELGVIGFWPSNPEFASAPGPLLDTNWHHVAVSRATNNVRFYADGILMGGGVMTNALDFSGDFRIGEAYPYLPHSRFPGQLDDLMLFNRALNLTDIQRLASTRRGGFCPSEAGLTLVNPLSEVGVGQTAPTRFRIRNHGSQTLNNCSLTVTFPDGLPGNFLPPEVGTAERIGGKILFRPGPIKSGSFADLTVNITTLAGTNHIQGELVVGDPEISTKNNSATWAIEGIPTLLTAQDVTTAEPIRGRKTLTIPAKLSSPPISTVQIPWRTRGVTATAGLDFISSEGILTFEPGQMVQNLKIEVLGDSIYELDEVLLVEFSETPSIQLATPTVRITINSFNPPPELGLKSIEVVEGDEGYTDALFKVQVTGSFDSFLVRYQTEDGSALAGQDYDAVEGELQFTSGQTELPIRVRIRGDRIPELNEMFSLRVWFIQDTFGRQSTQAAVCVIRNDDKDPANEIQLVWEDVPDRATPGQSFSVGLKAVNTLGGTDASYNQALKITAIAGGRRLSPVVISRVDFGGVMVNNVSSTIVDLSGWAIAFYDGVQWPLPATLFVVPAGVSLKPGEFFTIGNNSSSRFPGTFPSYETGAKIHWIDPLLSDSRIGAVLMDRLGRIEDVFLGRRAFANELVSSEPITPRFWQGPPAQSNPTGSVYPVFARFGGYNSRTAENWKPSYIQDILADSSQTSLVLPFTDSAPMLIEPESITLTNGRWRGPLSIRNSSAPITLLATDNAGREAVSRSISIQASIDLSNETEMDAVSTTEVGADARIRIRNLGTNSALNVVVTQHWSSDVTYTATNASVGEVSSGTPRAWTWRVGTLAPGESEILEFRVKPSPGAKGLLKLVSIASSSEPDPNPFNNEITAITEVSSRCLRQFDKTIAWWPAENSGADIVGNHHATGIDGVTFGKGRVGIGFNLDGLGDGIRVASVPEFNITSDRDFSFLAWVRLDPLETRDWIVIAENASLQSFLNDPSKYALKAGWSFGLRRGRPVLIAADDQSQTFEAAASPNRDYRDGHWHLVGFSIKPDTHACMVYDSTLPTIETWPLGSVGSDSPLYLGGSVRREARATMQGQLDEIIIANRSITFFDCKRVEEVAARGFCLSTISFVPIASLMILPLGAQSDYSVELLNRGPLAAPSFTAIHYPVATNQLVISTDVGSATIQDPFIRWDIQGLQTGAHAAMSIRTTPNEPIDFRYFSFQFLNTANELRLGLEDGGIGPVRVFADADRDQIEDGWETANGLDPTSAIDAEADPDRDGVNNRDEYLAGTDPRLASSRLELWISHRPDAITVLLPATSTEVYYYVESLENAAFTRWIIRGGSFGTGGPLEIQTVPASNASTEFFRIRAERMRN